MRGSKFSWVVLALAACAAEPAPAVPDAGAALPPRDVPRDGLSAADTLAFNAGDEIFEKVFNPPEGLGPLFSRASCEDCHANGLRGPGIIQKMSVVEADGFTAAPDQSAL